MADIKIALVIDTNNPVVGDLYLNSNGTVELTATLMEQVAQELFIRFRFFQGEWFLDRAQGIPYLQSILGQKTPIGILRQIFRRVLTSCPGVTSILSYDLTRDAQRGLAIKFALKLTDGTILKSSDFGAFLISAGA